MNMLRRHSIRKTAIIFMTAFALSSPLLADELTLDEKEQFLKTARIERSKRLSEGTTGASRATLSDGEFSHDAQIQTVDVYKMVYATSLGTELNFKDTYKANIAAYRLDRLLRLGMIPPSVERKVKGDSAAVTWWIDDFLMTEKERFLGKKGPPNQGRWNSQMYIVRVFDQLIYNMDRNLGNLVITNDWDLKMIDHTRAFRLHKKLKRSQNLVRCDRELVKRMAALTKEDLSRELKPYLNNGEIGALLARRDLILKHLEKQAEKRGESAVYYQFLPALSEN